MSLHEDDSLSRAYQDFVSVHRAGARRRFWTSLLGKENSLVPFDEVQDTLGLLNQYYRGIQPVPVARIIGSMGRSDDFDRAFLPTQQHSKRKWLSVDRAFLDGKTLPPISLYKVGDAYFVIDGHHRVSVARSKGSTFIDAEVTEVKSRVPVTTDLTLDDLDNLGAYQAFLEETRLDVLRPDQDVRVTMPGDYTKFLEHIRVHRYYVEHGQSKELDADQAVTHWYDHVYLPVVEAIRRNRILESFPKRTEADLYLWIIEHAYYLSQSVGWNVSPWQAAKDFAYKFSRRPQNLLTRLWQRIRSLVIPDEIETGARPGAWRAERVESETDSVLFRDILVTVTGAETGWRALAQAAEVTRRETGFLHGLHVAPNDNAESLAYGRQVLEEFNFRCQGLGIRSTTTLAVGNVAEKIVEHARWADLVVINQRLVHGQWLERPLGTIFQIVAEQAARPILAVPGTQVAPLRHVLLAYDESPKAREALFVFRHLVTNWDIQGTILTVAGPRTDESMLDSAWQYASESCTCEIKTRFEQGPPQEMILKVMEEQGADLLLMGGSGYQPLIRAFLGSTVDRILRQATFPVLICR